MHLIRQESMRVGKPSWASMAEAQDPVSEERSSGLCSLSKEGSKGQLPCVAGGKAIPQVLIIWKSSVIFQYAEITG